MIIAGHGRLLAARKLHMTEVPVIILSGLTEAQRRALVIADNQLALNAGWSDELLHAELAALQGEDFDLNVIGFDDVELARLLAAQDVAEGLTDEDAVPDLPETPTSAPGDLWILGNHRLLVGDSTKQADVAKLMGGEAFEEALDSDAISFQRRLGLLGYAGNGAGILLLGIMDTREKPFQQWFRRTQFGDPAEAIELHLKHGDPSLNREDTG